MEENSIIDINDRRRGNFVWQEWVEENRWGILTGLGGLVLLGLGVIMWGSGGKNQMLANDNNRVEFLSTTISPSQGLKVAVDVGGSVMKPGVYKLENGARVEEALVAAGGLTETADRVWVEKSLNRAAKVKDGDKLYIFAKDEVKIGSSDQNTGQVKGMDNISSVSINSASEAGLEALWGVGPATVKAIVEGRPYDSVEELIEKKIIKQNVWERNKDKLIL